MTDVTFESPPTKVSWLKRDAILFNLSIGCKTTEPHFLTELDPGFAVFPTYPLALAFKQSSQEVIDFYSALSSVQIPGVPSLDPSRLVDGQRSIEIFKPLPTTSAGRDFEFRSSILAANDKGDAGTLVKSQDRLVDASNGETYAQITGSLFYVGQGGWGGPRGQKEKTYPPPTDRKPDETIVVDIAPESAHLYRLNGDYNPLHAIPEPGKKMGYGGIIMHGVYTYNRLAHDILHKFGHSHPENFKEMHARFSGVVKPGDQVLTDLWRMGADEHGWEEIRWVAKVRGTGKVCLSDGRVIIRTAVPGTHSKL